MSIHFYYSGPKSPMEISDWNPEKEPMRYPDSEGHAFFQLYLGLRHEGVEATLGRSIPSDAEVILVFKKAKLGWRDQVQLFMALLKAERRVPIVVIAADCKNGRWNVFMHHAEVVANPLKQNSPSALFIPLLPQNGLVRRDGWSGKIGLYCHSKNYPALLLDLTFLEQLEKRGITLKTIFLDSEGREQMTNFSDISMSLCIRGGQESDPLRKPPTKLINAWNAQVIPIIDREPGYLSLGTPGMDCVLLTADHLNNPSEAQQELFEIFERYQKYEVAEPILANVARQATNYSRNAILARYSDMLNKLRLRSETNTWKYKLILIIALLGFPLFKASQGYSRWLEKYRIDVRALSN